MQMQGVLTKQPLVQFINAYYTLHNAVYKTILDLISAPALSSESQYFKINSSYIITVQAQL